MRRIWVGLEGQEIDHWKDERRKGHRCIRFGGTPRKNVCSTFPLEMIVKRLKRRMRFMHDEENILQSNRWKSRIEYK